MSTADHDASQQSSRPNSTRRERAPTITIDTSAVSSPNNDHGESHPMQPLSPQMTNRDQEPHQRNPSDATERLQPDEQPSGGLHVAPSFESRDSRPSTSPHNVSSSISKWSNAQSSFLSVPPARSRGNSVDSTDEDARSPTSFGGDTVIPSSGSSQNSDPRRVATMASGDHLLSNMDALKPDPGQESDFEVTNNPFAFSPGQLNKLLNPKSLSAYRALGGLSGLEKGLRTDRNAGLSVDEHDLKGKVAFEEAMSVAMNGGADGALSLHRSESSPPPPAKEDGSYSDRKRVFSDNRLPERRSKSFLELAWLAYNDKVLILLTVAAVVSLSLGIYESVRPEDPEPSGWVEGVAIIVAIVIVVFVGAANDYQKERQFIKLNRKKDDRVVKIIRSGRWQEVPVHDILVGDVVHIEPGDVTPVDGIYISGYGVQCDESSATGESDVLRKTPGDDAFKAVEHGDSVTPKIDPFIISGAKITEGVGTFMVTSTGVNSTFGKTLMSLQEDPQTTPLQSKLNKLAEYIAKLGLSAGLILFVVTFIEFIVRYTRGELPRMDPQHVAQDFLQLFITAVTIIVVAVPEGLPLAVTLALAFATTKMLKDNNLVRQLRACETMGNATTICSDKTGTLTQNKMSVVAATVGTTSVLEGEVVSPSSDTSSDSELAKESNSKSMVGSAAALAQRLPEDVKLRLKEVISLNSTAFEDMADGEKSFIGSKTETALLTFARDSLGMQDVSVERGNANIVQLLPFDSKRKYMATVVALPNNRFRLLVTGASEIVLSKCRRIFANPLHGVEEAAITEHDLTFLNKAITSYATQSLRTIGIAAQDFDSWPPSGAAKDKADPSKADIQQVFQNMTFLAVAGIKDPLRDGVAEAVKACQHAGVFVRMVTGDNIMTAKAIAEDCGIFTRGGIVMEGPQFRKMNRAQMNQTIPRLQVLARSSPEDKRVLVKRLRELGETVAVTGDGTNDAPALKTADVGFSMGISGTEVAKEASAIILMDDNFASIVKAMMWGRAVNDSVQKFLQFQLTVNITAVLLAFISAVSSANQESVITAVQLLWVNLIMDTFAALALATDPPTKEILNRDPSPKSAALITPTMWKMIIGQAIYQLAVTLVLYYMGQTWMGIDHATNAALVFNVFVWMQIFNQYNSRRLDNKLNILVGIHRNYFFIGIQVIICGCQILIIFFGGDAFKVVRLNGVQWAISLIIGLVSVLIGVGLRFIPDPFLVKLVPAYFKNRKPAPAVLVSDEEQPPFQWNPALEEIKEELAFIKLIHGGRISRLKHKLENPRELLPRSRSPSRSRAGTESAPRTPVAATAPDPPAHDPSSLAPPSTPGGASSVNPPDSPAPNTNTLAPPTPESARRSMGRKRGRSRSHSSAASFGPAAAMAGIVAGSIGGGFNPLGSDEVRSGAADAFAAGPLKGREDLERHPGVQIHPATLPEDPVLAEPVHDARRGPPSQTPETRPVFEGRDQSLKPSAL